MSKVADEHMLLGGAKGRPGEAMYEIERWAGRRRTERMRQRRRIVSAPRLINFIHHPAFLIVKGDEYYALLIRAGGWVCVTWSFSGRGHQRASAVVKKREANARCTYRAVTVTAKTMSWKNQRMFGIVTQPRFLLSSLLCTTNLLRLQTFLFDRMRTWAVTVTRSSQCTLACEDWSDPSRHLRSRSRITPHT